MLNLPFLMKLEPADQHSRSPSGRGVIGREREREFAWVPAHRRIGAWSSLCQPEAVGVEAIACNGQISSGSAAGHGSSLSRPGLGRSEGAPTPGASVDDGDCRVVARLTAYPASQASRGRPRGTHGAGAPGAQPQKPKRPTVDSRCSHALHRRRTWTRPVCLRRRHDAGARQDPDWQ